MVPVHSRWFERAAQIMYLHYSAAVSRPRTLASLGTLEYPLSNLSSRKQDHATCTQHPGRSRARIAFNADWEPGYSASKVSSAELRKGASHPVSAGRRYQLVTLPQLAPLDLARRTQP